MAGRVAFKYVNQGSYLNNLYPMGALFGSPGEGAGADLGGYESFVGRATLAFEPNENMRFTISGNGGRTDMTTGPYQSIPTIGVFDANGELIDVRNVDADETRAGIAADGSDFGSDLNNDGVFGDSYGRPAGTDLFGYKDPDGDGFNTSSDFAFDDHGFTETWGVNGRLEWDINEDMTLTSLTDYKKYDKLLFIDVDSAPVNQSANYAGVDATSFTQEIRLNGSTDSMRWVTGYFYLHVDNESDNGLKFPVGSPAGTFDLGVEAKLKTNSHSIFGQIEQDISDTVTFTIGGRLIKEEKDIYVIQSLYFASTDPRKIHVGDPVPIGPVAGGPYENSSDDTLWAGKVQVDWRPNEDLLLYAGINRGVKAGSFNAPIAGGLGVPVSSLKYDEEVLWSYEAGFKSTIMDGMARLNGSAYYYDYKGYQAFLFTGVSGVVVNADAENYGVELELQASPMDGLDLILSGAWFNATVKDVPLRAGGPISRDVNPTNAPEFQVTGLARYQWEAFGGMMSTQVNASYSDSFFYNLRNFTADKFDSYILVDARLGWSTEDESWNVGLMINNLTNERAGVQGFDLAALCGCNEVAYQAPRTYSIDVKYNF